MYRFFFSVSVLIFVMLIVPTYLEACPACKTLDDPIAKGLNWSILFLMAMPFTVFGIIGGTIFLHFNSNRLSALSLSAIRSALRVFQLSVTRLWQ